MQSKRSLLVSPDMSYELVELAGPLAASKEGAHALLLSLSLSLDDSDVHTGGFDSESGGLRGSPVAEQSGPRK